MDKNQVMRLENVHKYKRLSISLQSKWNMLKRSYFPLMERSQSTKSRSSSWEPLKTSTRLLQNPPWHMQGHTLQGLIARKCLSVINLQNFSSSMVREVQSNMWHNSLKRATMLGHTATTSSNNLFAPLREMLSIGTQTLSLVPLIVGNKWSKNFSTAFISHDVL